MRGGILRKFVIYTDMVAPGNGVMTPHEIRMTEVQLQGPVGMKKKENL